MALGKKTGGRSKGTRNKRTQKMMALVDSCTEKGVTPLEVMLAAMHEAWEKGDKPKAHEFAKDAAPYIHAKLQAVQHSGDADNPIEQVTRVELVVVDANDQGLRPAQVGAAAQARPL